MTSKREVVNHFTLSLHGREVIEEIKVVEEEASLKGKEVFISDFLSIRRFDTSITSSSTYDDLFISTRGREAADIFV
jgi:hypothetical protein